IVSLQLEKVKNRLKERKIKISFSPEAKKLIAEIGYNPTYGARPLKRVIQKEILDPLALKIVSGEIKEGDKVKIDAKNKKIVIK
ncbi:ATP-dependent Clp protease ATP-binding subunit, partial [bacterium]|nr:ATP-dependent Clp protease ATP-binding subunit [bacterium]